MNEATVNSVMSLVDELSRRLSVPAEKLLTALALRGIHALVFTIGAGVLLALLGYLVMRYKKKMFDGDKEDMFFWLLGGVPLVLTISFIFLCQLINLLTWLINPEAFAIQELLRMLK